MAALKFLGTGVLGVFSSSKNAKKANFTKIRWKLGVRCWFISLFDKRLSLLIPISVSQWGSEVFQMTPKLACDLPRCALLQWWPSRVFMQVERTGNKGSGHCCRKLPRLAVAKAKGRNAPPSRRATSEAVYLCRGESNESRHRTDEHCALL